MPDDKKELPAQLRFILNFFNHKFSYLSPDYQSAYTLIGQSLKLDKLYASRTYVNLLLDKLNLPFDTIGLSGDASFNLNPAAVEANNWLCLDHSGGVPANLDLVKNKDFLIEDVSLALGGDWQGHKLGSFGAICLIQLGSNLDDLLSGKPKLTKLSSQTSLYELKTPILITTKRFVIREKINLALKDRPDLGLTPKQAYKIIPRLRKLGRFIEELPWLYHRNQLALRTLYRQHKDKNLPVIYPHSKPYISFLLYR